MPDQPRSIRSRLTSRLLSRFGVASPARDTMRPRAAAAPPPAPRHVAPDVAPAAGPAMRADARLPFADRFQKRVDSVRNNVLGIGDDKVQAGRPDIRREPLTYPELASQWRFGGLARRFVEVLPNDATRKGWHVQDSEGDAIDVTAEYKRLKVIASICEADKWGRLFGGAWIMMVTRDRSHGPGGPDDKSAPLELDRVDRLMNLVILDHSEVSPASWDHDPESPTFRQPLTYRIYPRVGGRTGGSGFASGSVVHATRMVYFWGAKLTAYDRQANNGVDDSVLQYAWDQLRNSGQMEHGLAALAAEMRITTLKMRDLSDASLSDEAEYFDTRMHLLAKHKSILNTVLLSDNEEYVHHPGTVAGMAELNGTTREALQAVTGMPEQLWIGNAPGGLSSDGESHRNLWANVVSSYQSVKLLEMIERIQEVMFAAKLGPWAGRAPEGWRIKFNPLDELTEQGTAGLRKTVAETDAIYIAAGVLDPQRVAEARFGSKGWQMEIPALDPDAFAGGADLDMGAVLALLQAGGGAEAAAAEAPATPGPAAVDQPAAGDGSLADRRRLAVEMTDAQVRACEHGKSNRCPLCGIERRRALLRAEDGTPEVDENGGNIWGIQWAAIGDYEPGEDPAPDGGLSVLGLSRSDAASIRANLQRMLAVRNRRDAAPMGGMSRADDDGMVSIWVGVPLPADARASWQSARFEAATIARVAPVDLDMRGHQPHITALWVGKVPIADAEAEGARVSAALDAALGPVLDVVGGRRFATHRKIELQGTGLGSFAPSVASEGDTPIYVDIESPALRSLHDALSAALLGDDERRDRPHWYQPHATVGYLADSLTDEQHAALWDASSGRGKWVADEVQLSVGGVTVGRWSLADRGE